MRGKGCMRRETSCGGLFVDASGVITSPGYPGRYDNNEHCVYTIRAPSGNFVRLEFQAFSLESGYDKLRILEGGSEIQRYTGSSLPPTYISSTNAVQLVFTSDGSETLQGFNLTYSFSCSAFLDASGIITSPGYPVGYGNNEHCVYTISAPSGNFVRLDFQAFDLESGYDKLTISEGGTQTQRYTGSSLPPTYISSTNAVQLVFTSDGSVTSSGFHLTYSLSTEVTDDPENITQSLNQSAMFTCAGRGEPMPNVTWRHDGSTVPPGAVTTIEDHVQHTFNSSLAFNSVQRADNGEYTCTAANSLQTDISSPATLIVLERPGEINVSVTSQSSTTLCATADVGFTGNLPVTAIQVRYMRKGESFWGNWNSVGFAGTRGTVNITGLTPATDYIGQVRAQNSEGWSSSVQFTWRTRDARPPSGLQTSSVSNHSIGITWQRPAVTNGVITHYSIQYGPTTNCSDSELLHEVTTQGSNTSLTVPGLLPNTMYTFRVRGFTSAGPGNFTGCLNARTAAAAVYVQTKPTAFPLAAVIGGAVAAGVVIFAIAAALLFYRKKWANASEPTTDRTDQVPLDDIARHTPEVEGHSNEAYAMSDIPMDPEVQRPDHVKSYHRLSEIQTVADVTDWLRACDLEAYAKAFRDQRVDGNALRYLDDSTLKELIPHAGPRARFRGILAELRNQEEPQKTQVMALNFWEIPRASLKLGRRLGSGNFGQVRLGELRQRGLTTTVAVKTLKGQDSASDFDQRGLLGELEIMVTVGRHDNLISLVGACTVDGPLCIVVEYAPNGCLKGWLKAGPNAASVYRNRAASKSGPQLPMEQLIQFGIDVASGMSHLAMMQCIHRDLAARNILLGENLVAKVSDFGLSRDIFEDNEYNRSTKGRLPLRWMAYESLFYNVYTTQSDVWSFGVLMWEIMAMGKRPYEGISGKEMMDMIEKGGRLENPRGCPGEIYTLMTSCWMALPEERPTFPDLKASLQKMLQDYQKIANEDTRNVK
ncbi:hypothetical protein Bbelb_274500 [Branchiostoma belcheri]|nr:hypothetical protein Bbelb_274500 [Branchiostoma belcheri]